MTSQEIKRQMQVGCVVLLKGDVAYTVIELHESGVIYKGGNALWENIEKILSWPIPEDIQTEVGWWRDINKKWKRIDNHTRNCNVYGWRPVQPETLIYVENDLVLVQVPKEYSNHLQMQQFSNKWLTVKEFGKNILIAFVSKNLHTGSFLNGLLPCARRHR